jgi:multidrug efflux pump subunit AcrB
MELVLVMWALWAVSFFFMAGVSIVAAAVGRNEEAQIFLADSSNHERSEQAAIAAKVSKMRPLKMTSLGILGVMTLLVVGYYVVDVFKQFAK